MLLYYDVPETKSGKANILLDFNCIYANVEKHFPNRFSRSKLYRVLHKKCKSVVRYQNRDLFSYEDIIKNLPEFYTHFKSDE